ncbi:hypothetical protein ACFYO9_10930 [Streptomyces sp. NPDC005863]|uniref:hypothetical protein n=1 Tax=unclassified Streptomyces TaxID=2593676 RepID=UPI00340A876C
MIVDPSAAEVVAHTEPTGTGHITARTHKYGTGKLPIEPADGRTDVLDLDELPRPEPGLSRSWVCPVVGGDAALRSAR